MHAAHLLDLDGAHQQLRAHVAGAGAQHARRPVLCCLWAAGRQQSARLQQLHPGQGRRVASKHVQEPATAAAGCGCRCWRTCPRRLRPVRSGRLQQGYATGAEHGSWALNSRAAGLLSSAPPTRQTLHSSTLT